MIKIQKIKENRWKDLKKLRLEALQSHPIAFGSSYERERGYSEKAIRKLKFFLEKGKDLKEK